MVEIEKIADAILYEGYALFPYRGDALKNQKRFNFGVLAPRFWAENSQHETFYQQTECLVLSAGNSFNLSLKIRFLQLEKNREKWQTARKIEIEKSVSFIDLFDNKKTFDFAFEAEENFLALQGKIKISLEKVEANLFKIRIVLQNLTDKKTANVDEIQTISFLSVHTILRVSNGEFLSLLEPPENFERIARNCANIGVFPVLVGDKIERNQMLSSPIILYDFPEIAANSFADFFDGTEIDELMFLSILALTDEEKKAIKNVDEKMRRMMEKIESASPEDLLKLHSVMTDK